MIPHKSASQAVDVLKQGGLIIYPTEGIYGIGCDALNEKSVQNVFNVKYRNNEKSFIVLCSEVVHISKLISDDYVQDKKLSEKEFITWIVPISKNCPQWLTKNNKIAIRLTDHPVIKELCTGIDGPIISTSANISGKKYINNIDIISELFTDEVECIVEGNLGGEAKSSSIIDIATGHILRK